MNHFVDLSASLFGASLNSASAADMSLQNVDIACKCVGVVSLLPNRASQVPNLMPLSELLAWCPPVLDASIELVVYSETLAPSLAFHSLQHRFVLVRCARACVQACSALHGVVCMGTTCLTCVVNTHRFMSSIPRQTFLLGDLWFALHRIKVG